MTLEDLFVGWLLAAGHVATPLQRATCRIIDGVPLGELLTHPDVLHAVGDYSACDGIRPRRVDFLSGIRTGKSQLAAAVGVHNSQTCDVSMLAPGEVPRVTILSLKKDLADVILDHALGNVQRSELRQRLVGKPRADRFSLMHPEEREIEIAVVAGAGAGGSVVARWSAGCIFDEAPRMDGEGEGAVVNFDETARAAEGRLLPGAQIIAIGSPWSPRGPIYDAVLRHWRRPTPAHVVVRAPAYMLNPTWWTPERIASLSPDARRTDVDAEFGEREASLFSHRAIEACTRRDGPERIARRPGWSYVAAIDPATRGNAWTLAITTSDEDERRIVVEHRQWIGDARSPLPIRETLREIKPILAAYGLVGCWSDQWSADAIRELAAIEGVDVWEKKISAERKVEMYESLRVLVEACKLSLPAEQMVRDDLLSVKKRLTAAGIAIELPTSIGGRHADYASAIALSCLEYCPPPKVRQKPQPETEAALVARLEHEATSNPLTPRRRFA